jgi:hypothetical protein
MIDEYDITRQFIEAINKPSLVRDKDAVINEYKKYFDVAGFREYALDFSNVSADVVVLLGETLKSYLRKEMQNVSDE